MSQGDAGVTAAPMVPEIPEDAAAPDMPDLARMLDEHGDQVLAFCTRVLRDRILAEDVAQQVFLEAVRDIAGYRQRSKIRTWLCGIASHRCQDALKAQRRRRARITEDSDAISLTYDPGIGVLEQLTRSALMTSLDDCLSLLSDEARLAVLLRFQGDMSYEEMSRELATKSDTLQTRVSRAMPLLRRCMERKGWNGE